MASTLYLKEYGKVSLNNIEEPIEWKNGVPAKSSTTAWTTLGKAYTSGACCDQETIVINSNDNDNLVVVLVVSNYKTSINHYYVPF